jgi:imidazoleglycerol-phosphate dehydratase
VKRRTAAIRRTTRETDVSVRLNLDGKGRCRIETGIGFMDHMLELFGRHALLDLDVRARGDRQVDDHHTVEDIGLVLGTALDQALGERRGIRRYGWCVLPMDDALSVVGMDLGGRPYFVYRLRENVRPIRNFDTGLIEEFLRAFVVQSRMNLHVLQLDGREPHHVFESVFKGVARALRMAAEPDPRERRRVPSSKGVI